MKFFKKKYYLIPAFLLSFICFFILINFFVPFTFIKKETSKTQKLVATINRNPSNTYFNPYIIPRGTQFYIPRQIVSQYHASAQKHMYQNAMNFLIHNYAKAAPSALNPNTSTYYIPLSYDDDDNDFDDDYDDDDFDNDYDDDSYTYKSDKKNNLKDIMVDVKTIITRPTDKTKNNKQKIIISTQEIQKPTQKKQAKNTQQARKSIPDVPSYDAPEKPLQIASSSPQKNTCKKTSTSPSLGISCIDCIGLDEDKAITALKTLMRKVNNFKKNDKFDHIKKKFCKSCNKVNIKDFIQYIKGRAKQEKVPPAILFSIMLRESKGDCNAKGDGGRSIGLFQMNIKTSTKLKQCKNDSLQNMNASQMKAACKNKNYTSPFTKKGVCLNNPYCNFEEALHLLIKDKWSIGNQNKKYTKSNKSWLQMTPQERNEWRNTIISYNGAAYLNSAKKSMTKASNTLKDQKIKNQLLDTNNWELKRMFFISDFLNQQNKKLYRIDNLAYVETITGRETPNGLADSSICKWIQFDKENTLDCAK